MLQELFQGHERPSTESLAARLKPWWGEGERAWLFDNDIDALQFDQRTTGFDLTFILDDAVGRTPTLMYLFHRVDQILTGQKAIIFIDEGWKALDHPAFEERIKDWLKTIRKRNGVLGFGSQSAKDALSSRIGDSIIEQSPTQIFMPNHKADRAAYCEGFGLTLEEYKTVRELSDTSRCFSIKHGTHSVIARLDLSGEDDLLAVLSGREETVGLLDQVRAEVGDDPDRLVTALSSTETLMKRLFLVLVFMFLLSPMPAAAQIPVTDVANFTQQILQYAQMALDYERQLEELIEARNQVDAITGNYFHGELLNGGAERDARRYTPTTWRDTLRILEAGGLPGSVADVRRIAGERSETFAIIGADDYNQLNPNAPNAQGL